MLFDNIAYASLSQALGSVLYFSDSAVCWCKKSHVIRVLSQIVTIIAIELHTIFKDDSAGLMLDQILSNVLLLQLFGFMLFSMMIQQCRCKKNLAFVMAVLCECIYSR